MSETRLILPMPPSANRLWRIAGKSMIKTQHYREWMVKAADGIAYQLGGAQPIAWFSVSIGLPVTRRDPDNGIKPILDALQHGGAIQNDGMLRGLTLDVHDDQPAEWVSIGLFDAPAPRHVQERQEQAHRATEAAQAVLADHREALTPHTMERLLKAARMHPDDIRPEMAASILRLANRVMARRV